MSRKRPVSRSGLVAAKVTTEVLSRGERDFDALMTIVEQTSLFSVLAQARDYVDRVEAVGRRALESAGIDLAGRPLWPLLHSLKSQYAVDSEVGFALRILERVRDAKAQLVGAERAGDAAAVDAFIAGVSLAGAETSWGIEFGLKAPLASGLKSTGTGRAGGLEKAAIERPAKQRERACWQARADDLWARHPDWSVSAVAVEIEKWTGKSRHTIRGYIKKPDWLGATRSTV